jgi:hypothetical protein
MQTLVPRAEQVVPGNTTPDQEDGKLRGPEPPDPESQRGGVDPRDPTGDTGTGNEGAGT